MAALGRELSGTGRTSGEDGAGEGGGHFVDGDEDDTETEGECWAQLAEAEGRKVVRDTSLGSVNTHKFSSASLRLGQARVLSRAHRLSSALPISSMSSDTVLPGQPTPLPRGPVPQLGGGIYSRDGIVRASLVGVPQYSGSVGFSCRSRLGQL